MSSDRSKFGCLGRIQGGGLQRGTKLFKVTDKFILVMVSLVYIFVKIHQVVRCNYVLFIHQLYFKAEKIEGRNYDFIICFAEVFFPVFSSMKL